MTNLSPLQPSGVSSTSPIKHTLLNLGPEAMDHRIVQVEPGFLLFKEWLKEKCCMKLSGEQQECAQLQKSSGLDTWSPLAERGHLRPSVRIQ